MQSWAVWVAEVANTTIRNIFRNSFPKIIIQEGEASRHTEEIHDYFRIPRFKNISYYYFGNFCNSGCSVLCLLSIKNIKYNIWVHFIFFTQPQTWRSPDRTRAKSHKKASFNELFLSYGSREGRNTCICFPGWHGIVLEII